MTLSPARAAGQDGKPVTDDKVTAKDVAMTPASDLNLRKDEVPALLLAAQERPYDLGSAQTCPDLAAATAELDQVLGPDLDKPQNGKSGLAAGRVAQAAVGSFIPFRGLIREISGANEQQRRMQAAIAAGIARRAYLKGYAQAKGCNARPQLAQTAPVPVFVSRPVVQAVD